VLARRACLSSLPAQARRVLVLRAGADRRTPGTRSRQRVARALDLPVSRVRSLERQGLARLRAIRGACGGAGSDGGTAGSDDAAARQDDDGAGGAGAGVAGEAAAGAGAGAVAGARAGSEGDADGSDGTASTEGRTGPDTNPLTRFGSANIAGVEVLVPVLLLVGVGLLALLAGLVRVWRRRDDDDAAADPLAGPRPVLPRRQP
jgi:hypothetical protein